MLATIVLEDHHLQLLTAPTVVCALHRLVVCVLQENTVQADHFPQSHVLRVSTKIK